MTAGAIMFDFDGTIVDARESSWELFQETNRAFALGINRREDFFEAFEGNFFESLAEATTDPGQVSAVKAHFLDLMRTRYRPKLIPGIVDVVRALAPSYTLAVLSSNTMETIRRTLESAGIATCFSHVFAGDVEPSKAASIRLFLADRNYGSLRQCALNYASEGPTDLLTEDVYLVTDTIGDVIEARRCGIHAVGVAWGMHDPAPLLDAGAERVALWPQELIAWFTGEDPLAHSCDSCQVGCSCDRNAPAAACHSLDELTEALTASCGRRRHERLAARAAANRRLTALVAPAHTQSATSDAGELRRALARTIRGRRP